MTSPILNPVLPYVGSLPMSSLQYGQMIRIQGQVHPNPKCFAVNLQLGPRVNPRDDIALHLSPVFSPPPRVVRNSLDTLQWGAEESHGGFPFVPGQAFEIIILAQPDAFKIAINGYHFADFRHRLQLQHISHLTMDGDISVNAIIYEMQGSSSHSSAPLPQASPNIPPYPTGAAANMPPYPVSGGNIPFPPSGPAYPPPSSSAYPPQGGSYPPLGGSYPPAPHSSAYPPPMGSYPAGPSGYQPQNAYPGYSGGYPQQAGGYVGPYPTQQGYPAGGYVGPAPYQGGYPNQPYKSGGMMGGMFGGKSKKGGFTPGGVAGLAAGVGAAALGASMLSHAVPKMKMKKMFKHKFKGPKFLKHKGWGHKGWGHKGWGKKGGFGKFKHKGWGYDSD